MPFGFGLKRSQESSEPIDSDLEYFYDYGRRVENLRTPVGIDSNFKGHRIAGLNSFTFESALEEKSAAMVMFYRSHDHNLSTYMDRFCEAARCTRRENHIFAAVDCAQEEELCQAEGIYETPAYSLYTRGYRVGKFNDVNGMTAEMLRTCVENAPAMVKPKLENKYVKPVPAGRSSYDEFRYVSDMSTFR